MLLSQPGDIALEPADEALYRQHFAPFGFKRAKYVALMQAGEWRDYRDGDVIVPAGAPHSSVCVYRPAHCYSMTWISRWAVSQGDLR